MALSSLDDEESLPLLLELVGSASTTFSSIVISLVALHPAKL
ncbi:hypothetical protein [uncultured Methanobrevibacter sp.]